MKKVIIVNKFGPESNAITGKNAKELADYLSDHNTEVAFVCLQASYKQLNKGQNKQQAAYKVRALRSFYNGNSAVLRLLNSLLDGFRLWLVAAAQKCHAVIVMTDPPLLFFWFQLFRPFSKRKLCYWTMDLYPDAFVAGRYVHRNNVLYKFLHRVVYSKPPDLTIVLGRKQLEYLCARFNRPLAHVIIPCGIVAVKNISPPPADNNYRKITFGYGGNVGEAHDAEFLISLVKLLDPDKHEIVVSLYGSKAQYVTNQILHTKAVRFKDFLNMADIAAIDVNVASLLPQWHHICVPSKAVTAICCGTSLLLNATEAADAWDMFKEGSWLIEAGKDYTAEITKYLATLSREEINMRKINTRVLAALQLVNQKEAFRSVAAMVQNM